MRIPTGLDFPKGARESMRNTKFTSSFPAVMMALLLLFAAAMVALSYTGYKLIIALYDERFIILKQQTTSLDHATAPVAPETIELPIQSTPTGAKVWSVDNWLLCEKTPCRISVPAHAPLELHFGYPGFELKWRTNDPALELQKGGVRVHILPSKVR